MYDKIIPIVLAAGKGNRFGPNNKLLYKIDGKSILERTLDVFLKNFEHILVVLGNERDKIGNLLDVYDQNQVKPIYNNNWEGEGMSSSVKIGVTYSIEHYTSFGVVIQPGDMPYSTENSVHSVILKAKEFNYQKIVIPQYKGKRGHPLFIPGKFLSQVLKINEKTQGLKGFISQNDNEIVYVECSKEILKDIDRKEDIIDFDDLN